VTVVSDQDRNWPLNDRTERVQASSSTIAERIIPL